MNLNFDRGSSSRGVHAHRQSHSHIGVPTAPMPASDHTPVLRTAVMPHRPSDVVLFPVSSSPPPAKRRQQVEDRALDAEHSAEDDLRVDAEQPHLQHSPTSHSPVTRLPSEILMRVFELYAVASREESVPFNVAPGPGPFHLMQVCKFWGAVAELDYHLWTSVNIYFPDSCPHQDEDASRVKAMLDLHLKRSAALPISLTFTDHRAWYAPTEDTVISLLADCLRTHAQRWKSITLHLSDRYVGLLSQFIPCNLACLERLSISCDLSQVIRVPHNVRIASLNLPAESAPNLRSFAYSGLDQSLINHFELNWEDLTDVSFDFTPHRSPRSALSSNIRQLAQCQNITTCSLGIKVSFPFARLNPILLPNLRTLYVRRFTKVSHVRRVIGPLILPQLQTLDITIDGCCYAYSNWIGSSPYSDFSRLLARSGCSLRRLSIQDPKFPTGDVARCLARSPKLTSFRFIPNGRPYDVGDIIRKLDVTVSQSTAGTPSGRGNAALVPELRDITLGSSTEEHLELMMAMFRSRSGADAHAAGVAPLRQAKVMFMEMSHDYGVCQSSLARFRRDLGRLTSTHEGEERLEVSVTEESLYHVEYIRAH